MNGLAGRGTLTLDNLMQRTPIYSEIGDWEKSFNLSHLSGK
jgi:hypothetical protein